MSTTPPKAKMSELEAATLPEVPSADYSRGCVVIPYSAGMIGTSVIRRAPRLKVT